MAPAASNFKTGALNRSATHPEQFRRPAAQTE
jgi:hypothetical protein